jgi:hypothetical protein
MRLNTIGEEQLVDLREEVEACLPPPIAYQGSRRLLNGRL